MSSDDFAVGKSNKYFWKDILFELGDTIKVTGKEMMVK